MIVVAGASGRTGRVVAETLLRAGRRVRVLVRAPKDARLWREQGADARLVSLDDARAVRDALVDATALYALVPEQPQLANLRAQRRAMVAALSDAVRANGVAHVVLLSAAAASQAHGNGLAAELNFAEQSLRGTGTRLSALRASYFQENVLAALTPATQAGIYPNFLPRADMRIAMVATVDVARAAVRCLLEPPTASEIVDLAGPHYSANDAADTLAAVLKRPVRVVEVPAERHVSALREAGLSQEFAEALAELYRALAASGFAQGDRAIVGHTTLEQTLARAIGELADAAEAGPRAASAAVVPAAGGTRSC